MTFSKLTLGGIVVSALILPMQVQAEASNVTDNLLSYDKAMRCGALHTFFAVVNDDDKEQEKFHDDMAKRWVVLAMVRDGADGGKADKEFEPLVGSLIDHVNSMEDDETAMTEFLEEGVEHCSALQEANQTEFDAAKDE